MWKKILIGLAVVILLFLGFVAIQPSHYSVTRSAMINAPPDVVFAQVNDFRNWDAWSPWKKLDPAAKNSFEGPKSGVGSVFRWIGNSNVGEGSMTILESHPSDFVRIRLDFVKPMAGTSLTEFAFKPENKGTAVTWTMSGENSFLGKAMCLFMNMDKMIGGNFEEGLASIKTIAEGAATK
jgi:hypothetical protein